MQKAVKCCDYCHHFRKKFAKFFVHFDVFERGSYTVANLRGRRFDPCRPKRSPFFIFWDIQFWLTGHKISKDAFGANNLLSLRGRTSKKRTVFRSKFFKNCFRKLFLPVFSQFCLLRAKFGQNSVFLVFSQSLKYQFSQPKKRSTKFSIF